MTGAGAPQQDGPRALARALVLEAPERLVPREFELPATGEDDGLLRVEACGLCGTDHELFSGVLPGAYPFVPGHESVGTIEAIGPAAAARWGVKVGDRVAVEVFLSCRRCAHCLAGEYRRCDEHGLGRTYGFISAETPPGLWGGYSQRQYLAPDSIVLPVPSGLDPVVATLFNPLGAGIRWGVTVPGTGPGDVVAVLGPGVRGLSACAAAKEAGAAFILVTGVLPHDAARLALAKEFGADLVVDAAAVAEPDLGAVWGATGGRGGRGGGRDGQGTGCAGAGGRAGTPRRDRRAGRHAGGRPRHPGFGPDSVVYKELRMLGALGVDTTAYRAARAALDRPVSLCRAAAALRRTGRDGVAAAGHGRPGRPAGAGARGGRPVTARAAAPAAAALRRPLRVVVIGAGFAGVLSAIKLTEAGFDDMVVYEKNEGLGGTWRENTYPGVSLRRAVAALQLLVRPQPGMEPRLLAREPRSSTTCSVWPTPTVSSGCSAYGVEVTGLEWDGARWQVTTSAGDDVADVVIAATGVLHHPSYPDIAGRD